MAFGAANWLSTSTDLPMTRVAPRASAAVSAKAAVSAWAPCGENRIIATVGAHIEIPAASQARVNSAGRDSSRTRPAIWSGCLAA